MCVCVHVCVNVSKCKCALQGCCFLCCPEVSYGTCAQPASCSPACLFHIQGCLEALSTLPWPLPATSTHPPHSASAWRCIMLPLSLQPLASAEGSPICALPRQQTSHTACALGWLKIASLLSDSFIYLFLSLYPPPCLSSFHLEVEKVVEEWGQLPLILSVESYIGCRYLFQPTCAPETVDQLLQDSGSVASHWFFLFFTVVRLPIPTHSIALKKILLLAKGG